MNSRDRRITFAALAALAALATSAHTAPLDRKGLVVRGRLTEPGGWPIDKVRVVIEGDRNASATSDRDGRWSITLPLGTVRDLVRAPVHLALRVRDRTRRYSLADGNRELALALQCEGGDAHGALLAVRASDPHVVEAVTRALRDDGDANALIEVVFVGRAGEAVPDQPAPLQAYEAVVLPGVAAPAAPTAATPAPAASAARAPAPAPVILPPPAPTPARATAPSNVTPAPANSVRPAAPAPSATTSSTGAPPAAVVPRALPRDSLNAASSARTPKRVARDAGPRLATPSRVPDRAPQSAPAPEAPATAPPPPTARTAPTPAIASPLAITPQTVAPPALAPPSVATPATPSPAAPETLWSSSAARRAHEARAKAAKTARPGAGASRTRGRAPAPPALAVRDLPIASARLDTSRAAGSAADPVLSGTPEPWSRVEVLTPSRFHPEPAAGPAADTSGCTCRIEGTIEVRSEQPLARRLPLIVVLTGAGAKRDTVELFMGSPRAFTFPHTPCGRRVLDVAVPDGERFRLVTPPPMRTVDCSAGRLRQVRLVLEPR
ncbi:MAG TPA: hypothetical protein VL332_10905 [Candidatus Saccharimonadaceae bacterium]|jgi:hypothetical protein|nr:hypothetical protein [Candidatus Saccharimonadaceae bacterium]